MNSDNKPKSSRRARVVMDIKPVKRRAQQASSKLVPNNALAVTKQMPAKVGTAVKQVATKTVASTKALKPSRWQKINAHPLKNHPFVVPVLTFVSMSFVAMALFVVSNGNTLGASDTRVINLSIDGVNQVVPSRANTVKELLEQRGIQLAEKDIVEPALDTEIVTDAEFGITVHKARPVVVSDGSKETVIVTALPDPRKAAEATGLKIYPEDNVEVVRTVEDPEAIIRDGLVVDKVMVERAIPIKLNLYGVTYDIRTHADTVGDLVKEKGLSNVSVFPEASTALTIDKSVFVTDASRQITVIEEEIPQEVQTVNDLNLERGKTEVREAGRVGRKAVIYEISADGSKKPLQEVVLQQPIAKVVANGRKLLDLNVSAHKQEIMKAAGIPAGSFSYVDYIVTKESRWNAGARNKSSGAYGLCQALPGTKMTSAGADWETNPVTQLRWCNGYALGRYGSWERAYVFWLTNHWW